MKPEVHTRVTITGEFDPDEVMRRRAVGPQSTTRRGEL